MLEYVTYVRRLREMLCNAFGNRLDYIGLQGSYLRGEATENSDIDIMVVISDLSADDLDIYRSILMQIGDYEKSCGFICSTSDLAAWNPMEICNLLHSTKDIYGNLSTLVPPYKDMDVRNFARLSLNNLHHEITHRYIHASMEKNVSGLQNSYKQVFFILQTLIYLSTGVFYQTKAQMFTVVTNEDKTVLEIASGIRQDLGFSESFEILFNWCHNHLLAL